MTHAVLSVPEAERRTGRPAHELEREYGVQTFVRQTLDGTREEMFRVPLSLLVGDADGDGGAAHPAAPG